MTGRERLEQVRAARERALPLWEAEPPSRDHYGMLDVLHDVICAADDLDGCILLTAEEAHGLRVTFHVAADEDELLFKSDFEKALALLTPDERKL